MQTVWYLLAAIVGTLLGFGLKGALSKEKTVHAEQENARLSAELGSLKETLERAKAESEARASFEALATERQGTVSRLESERAGLREELRVKGDTERDQAASISKLEAELKSEREGLAEKVAILENAKQALAHQFEALAGRILDEKSKSFSDAHKTELSHLLTPLREQITEFRTKVEQAQTDSKTGVTKLETLIGTLGGLNMQLAEEARNLTTALRGSSKAQGDWGEFILRDLLEKAGLREGEQYTFQQRFFEAKDDGVAKTSITDVIIKLPGGRHLIIDSKVSMDAYTDWVNSQDETTREGAMIRHLSSMRSHINELASRRYQELSSLETLDFVVMFVPIEPAFLAAIRAEERLWADSYKQKVLLVSPTTLLFVIRIVYELWDQEVKAKNYREVMDRGSRLYDKFVGFLKDLEGIGTGLANASNSFEEAKKKLTLSDSSLVRQVERLRTLGVTPKVKKTRSRAGGLAVIPGPWLDGSVVGQTGVTIAASSEFEDDEELIQEGDGEFPPTI
jgi:DNA recombination protein RmuC